MTYAAFAAARSLLAARDGIPPEAVPIPAVLAALSPPAATQPVREAAGVREEAAG
jgi:hypothetical protein